MRLKICTEADYLQAHITVLGTEPRPSNPLTLKLRLKLWASSFFKKLSFNSH